MDVLRRAQLGTRLPPWCGGGRSWASSGWSCALARVVEVGCRSLTSALPARHRLSSPAGLTAALPRRHALSRATRRSIFSSAWLPDGWTLTDEGGSAGFARSTYAKALGAPSVTVNLTSSADGLEQFRGAESEGTATVQGRPAIWVHSIQEPAASALILHDDHWTLIIQGSDSTIGHDVVERIAESLAPLPLSMAAFAPTVPGAWVGTISEVSGKYGRAVVTGWLVIDSSGTASICDDLPADATECSGPTFVIDWYTPGSGPPDGLVARGDTLVSAAPITLHGLVKDNTISVGL